MRRRALLSTVPACASLVAGCSMFGGESAPRESFDVSETGTAPTTALSYDVDASALSTAVPHPDADEYAIAMTTPTGGPDALTVNGGFWRAAAPGHPTTVYLEIGISASADEHIDVPVGETPPLESYEGTTADGDRELLLVPEEAGVSRGAVVRRDVGCWRPILPVGPTDDADGTAVPGTGTGELAPGTFIGRAYFLVTPWASDRCLPTGQYAFESAMGWRFWICSFDASGPDESRFETPEMPSSPQESDVFWYHEADPPVHVAPAKEQLGLPLARNRFTFRNRFNEPVAARPDDWVLYKVASDEWFPIAPLTSPSAPQRLLPGRSITTSLTVYSDPERAPTDDRQSIGGLGPGRYALNYPAELVRQGDDSVDGDTMSTAALFDVVGPETELSASGAVDHVRHAADVVHAYTTAAEDSVAVLQLERIDAAPSHALILEQVLQREALRNALVVLRDAAPDVSGVAYHVDPTQIERVMPWLDDAGTGVRFAFEGEGYAMTYA